jgi:hypothetical protein
LAIETAGLRIERSLVLNGLSRVALIAAVASNADKAAAVFAARSAPGSWSPWALAVGLELALGVSAYALAARLNQQSGAKVAPLWITTGVFAGISAAANVVYFAGHSGPGGGELALSVLFGLAAPAVALASAALTGDVAGDEQARAERRDEWAAQLAAQQAETERLALVVELERHRASQERARARAAKAGRAPQQPARPPVRASQPSTGRDARLSVVLDAVRREPSASYRRLAELSGVSKSTVGAYLSELEQAGRVRRNGHGWEVIAEPSEKGETIDHATL